jgi:hypothetical protein
MTIEELQRPLSRTLEQDCVVCENANDFPETTHLKEHIICHGCIGEYLRNKIMEEGVVNIPCPIFGCSVVLQYDDIKLYVNEAEFRRYKYLMLSLK